MQAFIIICHEDDQNTVVTDRIRSSSLPPKRWPGTGKTAR